MARKYTKYTTRDKAAALAALALNSNLDNPVSATAHQLQIPLSTLFIWSQGRYVNEEVKEILKAEKGRVAELYDEIQVMGALRIQQRLLDDDACAKTPLKDLNVTTATATDKSRLLRGESTSITQTLPLEEKRERVLELLRGKDGIFEAQNSDNKEIS